MRRLPPAVILVTTALAAALAVSACDSGTPSPAPATNVPATTTGAPTSAAPKPVQLTTPQTLPGYRVVQEGDMHLYAGWAFEALKAVAPQSTGNVRGTYEDTKTKATLSVAAVAVEGGSVEQFVKAFDLVGEFNNLKGMKLTLEKPSAPSEGCSEVTQPEPLYVCGWIDGQTMGILTWVGAKPSDGPAQMAQIRQSIVVRS